MIVVSPCHSMCVCFSPLDAIFLQGVASFSEHILGHIPRVFNPYMILYGFVLNVEFFSEVLFGTASIRLYGTFEHQ